MNLTSLFAVLVTLCSVCVSDASFECFGNEMTQNRCGKGEKLCVEAKYIDKKKELERLASLSEKLSQTAKLIDVVKARLNETSVGRGLKRRLNKKMASLRKRKAKMTGNQTRFLSKLGPSKCYEWKKCEFGTFEFIPQKGHLNANCLWLEEGSNDFICERSRAQDDAPYFRKNPRCETFVSPSPA